MVRPYSYLFEGKGIQTIFNHVCNAVVGKVARLFNEISVLQKAIRMSSLFCVQTITFDHLAKYTY